MVSPRAVKTLKSTLSTTWTLTLVLALFIMNLVMWQEVPGGGGAPTGAEVAAARGACGLLASAALAQGHASSSLARCLPAPAFAAYADAALAFADYSGWPVLLILVDGGGRVHGEVAVYYWFFLALMPAAVPLVIAGAIAGDDD
ncbi:hypothetical protein SEVIR_4G071850v4 [Setaria viridis]